MSQQEWMLNDAAFSRAWAAARPFTMTSIARGFALWSAVEQIARLDIPGSLVECGCWRGGSTMLMALAARHFGLAGRRIFVFDTFSGMTEPTQVDVDWRGRAASELMRKVEDRNESDVWAIASLGDVRSALTAAGLDLASFTFIEGDVRGTLKDVRPGPIALLRLDTDFYDSTAEELSLLYPQLVPGGVLLIDDYGHWAGAMKAVDEYFNGQGRRRPFLHTIDYTARIGVKPSSSAEAIQQRYDHIPLGMLNPDLLRAFPNLQIDDANAAAWPWLRRNTPHHWRTDNRAERPMIGVLSVEEATVLYNLARQFAGKRGLEIGCHLGWSTAHLLAAGVDLDVIDPALSSDAHQRALEESLNASKLINGGEFGEFRLLAGFSPGLVEAIGTSEERRWALAFIDGDHEGGAPARDARAILEYMEEDALVIFHDLLSPSVANGLEVFRSAGWKTKLFNTAQVIGIAWRGAIVLPSYSADPNMPPIEDARLAGEERRAASMAHSSAVDRASTRIDKLESDLTRRAQLASETESELQRARDQLGATASRIRELEEALKGHGETIHALTAMVASGDARSSSQAAEIQELLRNARERDRQRRALDVRLAAYDSTLKQTKQELRDKHGSLKSARDKLSAQSKELTVRYRKVTLERERVAMLEASLAKMHKSLSWRVTAPLRFSAGIARRYFARPNGAMHGKDGLVRERTPRSTATNEWRHSASVPQKPSAIVQHVPADAEDQWTVIASAIDKDYYLERYPDIARAGTDPVAHYIKHGAREGRDPSPEFVTKYYISRYRDVRDSGLNPYYHYLTVGKEEGRTASPLSAGDYTFDEISRILGHSPEFVEDNLSKQRADLRARLRSGVLAEVIDRAGALEPMIHQSWPAAVAIKIPPIHSPGIVSRIVALASLQTQAERRRSRCVVVIRACRVSGAAKVASYLARALAQIHGVDQVVVVRSDQSDMLFPEWFPEGCRHIDFAGAAKQLDESQRQHLLVEFIRSLRPVMVFNVNSRALWDAMEAYGRALATSTALYAYLFCNEKDIFGRWVGYPNRVFYRHFSLLRGVITDSTFLENDLRTRFLIPTSMGKKLTTLNTPTGREWEHAQRPAPGRQREKQVFWAGRFDRQKRVDIVYAIAGRMPEIRFRLWGEPVLEKSYESLTAPTNVSLEGVYQDLRELPFGDCDLWLYTSEWDGVPNMLIEVAALGVPLVGSIAGGTADILRSGLCERVEPIEDIDEYIRGINRILLDPVTAQLHADALREMVLRERSSETYRSDLERFLAGSSVA